MFGAVDIGGTKTLVAVFDNDGHVVEEKKFPTSKNYNDFKIELAKVVAELSTKDFLRTGAGIPGRIDRAHGAAISLGNLGWKNRPVQKDLEIIFKSPIDVENDAKLAGLSEALEVKDKFKRVLYITISTGIGVALIENGVIDTEIGDGGGKSFLLEHQGKLEPWEDFASGSAIVRRFGKRASEINDVTTWKIIAHDIALGLRDVIALLQPDVTIIGGGVGAHFEKYEVFLNEELHKFETPISKMPPISKARRSEEAVIYGCYEYTKRHYEELLA